MNSELPVGYIRVYLMNPDLLPEDSRVRQKQIVAGCFSTPNPCEYAKDKNQERND